MILFVIFYVLFFVETSDLKSVSPLFEAFLSIKTRSHILIAILIYIKFRQTIYLTDKSKQYWIKVNFIEIILIYKTVFDLFQKVFTDGNPYIVIPV